MAREQQTGSDGRRASVRPAGARSSVPAGARTGRATATGEAALPALDAGAEETRRVGRRRAAGPSRGLGAANDDAPSIGGLIFALNQKPTGQPFYYAGLGTAVWAVLGLMIGWVLLGGDILAGKGFGQILTSPGMVATLTAIAVPVALMWFLALLIWRTQELRLVSSAMTEVAVRLAEPDRQADQAVASLGQSVRRQVSAMNDAISRAIGRAGELEVLVHNEVAALERSYDENEHRIRSLIDELASERDALANNSERVADTLREVGAHLKDEIATAGERAARALSQASSLVADQLNEKGNSLYSSLSVMSEKIGSEVPQLIERLGHEQTQLTRIIDGAGRNLVALEAALAHRTGELDTVLNERVAELDASFSGHAEAMEASIGTRSQQLQQLLHDYTYSLNARLDEVADGLQQTGSQVEHALTDRAQALDAALLERTRAIDAAFADRMRGLDEHMAHGFEQRLRTFEENVTNGTAAIDDALAQRTAALRHAMESHAHSLNDILERQSSGLDQTLVRGIESVRRASETITNQSVQTINSLSMQAKFLKEVSEDLLKQMGSLTDRFETQGQSIMQVATAIETSSTRIDGARQNSDAIRRTLEDQLRALDTLSSYSRQAASARDITAPDASTLPSLTQSFQQRATARPMAPAYAPSLPASTAVVTSARAPAPRDAWSLGDLLARASRDEDANTGMGPAPMPAPSSSAAPAGVTYLTPPPSIAAQSQPLDLTNIAEALDAATAADVWNRLRSGESGVLSRAIYSRSGQATFDEILQRYRTDTSFQSMADRYLADFERLLREADAKDPSGRTLAGHLQGDTGRVYLMLAHASGRLG